MAGSGRRRSSGGRLGARRTVVLLTFVAALVAGAQPGATGETVPATAVRVDEKDGVYAVSACFRVPQSPDVVRAVLTDYENIPRFMSGVKSSVVIERAPGHVTVEQEAVSRLMLFSKRVHLLLDITEGPDTLRFQDRSGRSFRRYEGSWRFTETNGAMTQVTYALVAEPSFDVPQLILKRLLSRDSSVMIDGLREEMAARSLRHSAGRSDPGGLSHERRHPGTLGPPGSGLGSLGVGTREELQDSDPDRVCCRQRNRFAAPPLAIRGGQPRDGDDQQ